MKLDIKRPLIVFAAGLVLVGASSVGATRAAVAYQANADEVDFSTSKMTVDLQEGFFDEETEKFTDYRSVDEEYLYLPAIEKFNVGQKYEENIRVLNDSPGGYDEYVRITIKKSWYKDQKMKDTELDPDNIELGLEPGWIIDDVTSEGATYYYTKPLKVNEAAQFVNSVKVKNEIWKDLDVKLADKEGITLYDVYNYNNRSMRLDVEVDAVQAHNGEEAMLGAWGVNAEIAEDGTVLSIDGSSEVTKIGE